MRLVEAEYEEFDHRSLTLAEKYYEYDLYLAVQRGGPGLGDPLERDPRDIQNDLDEGFILQRFAEGVYGAALTNENGRLHVDEAATEERRAELRKERAEKAVPVSEYIEQERQRVLNGDFHEPVREMYESSMQLSESWAAKYREFWNLPEDFTFSREGE